MLSVDASGPPFHRDQYRQVQVDAVTEDVIVRDPNGNFLPDLRKNDFEIYEDGSRQDIVSMTLIHGGRVSNLLDERHPIWGRSGLGFAGTFTASSNLLNAGNPRTQFFYSFVNPDPRRVTFSSTVSF